MKWFLRLSGLVILGLVGFMVVFSNARPVIHLPEPTATQGKIKIAFAGASSLLVTDGEVQWCLDCFFSRPGLLEVAFTGIEPNRQTIKKNARALFRSIDRPEKLEAVLVAHSHYDHAMDAADVVNLYGGRVAGSESTRQIALGHGLASGRFDLLGDGDFLTFGDFTVKAIESRHAPTGFTGGKNSNPLTPPAHATAYKEGLSYAFAVWHGAVQSQQPLFIIQPSAGFRPGQFDGLKTNHLFLAITGLGRLNEEDVQEYWRETVGQTNAKNVYLIHWDDFTRPLRQGRTRNDLLPVPYLMDELGTTLGRVNKLAKAQNINLRLLQSFSVLAIENR